MTTKKDKFGFIHNIPENEVKKFKDLVNGVNYLANSEKEPTSNMPKTFIDEFNERRKKNSEEADN